jgi:hypothetical protein
MPHYFDQFKWNLGIPGKSLQSAYEDFVRLVTGEAKYTSNQIVLTGMVVSGTLLNLTL